MKSPSGVCKWSRLPPEEEAGGGTLEIARSAKSETDKKTSADFELKSALAVAGAEGLEPSTKVLETHVLPLHHTPKHFFIIAQNPSFCQSFFCIFYAGVMECVFCILPDGDTEMESGFTSADRFPGICPCAPWRREADRLRAASPSGSGTGLCSQIRCPAPRGCGWRAANPRQSGGHP